MKSKIEPDQTKSLSIEKQNVNQNTTVTHIYRIAYVVIYAIVTVSNAHCLTYTQHLFSFACRCFFVFTRAFVYLLGLFVKRSEWYRVIFLFVFVLRASSSSSSPFFLYQTDVGIPIHRARQRNRVT